MAGGRRAPGALAEPQRLMRSGLGLIVLGHGSLVLGAIVHGSVLRHVAGARRAVTPEYAAANVVSVCSGLLSIAAGIVAILVSHNLSRAVLVSAGLRAGGLGAALPRRQPLPWTLAPRAPFASAAAAGAAGVACSRLGPAGRSGRVGAPSSGRSASVGEAAAGSGVPRGLAGWAATGRVRRPGLGALHGARGKGRPAGRAHRGWKDAKGARASFEGVSEPSWKRREVVCAPRRGSSAETQVPCPSVSPSSCQSHSCSCRLQHWTLLGVSLVNCLLSTACSVGLALAFALTVHSRGTHLVRGCDSSALPVDARAAIATNDCPFNTTRIYLARPSTAMEKPLRERQQLLAGLAESPV
ncbi:keratinocyte-associated protein 3 isoform X2 [Onychostruthus taczanowskii]|uniref:keratinocyte-associated protein 3 isoform X2 n=1 Tax=Onychostruthus taczanowskii TaxID=356909 RepID=UPI001B80BD81|nr:keratinocyte-associated protein 3 isoform X2 [Onychostruthus taczanowskii]